MSGCRCPDPIVFGHTLCPYGGWTATPLVHATCRCQACTSRGFMDLSAIQAVHAAAVRMTGRDGTR